MTDYLQLVLQSQQVVASDVQTVGRLRDEIQKALTGGWKTVEPHFDYGGSFAKKTTIRESFGVDLLVYFKTVTGFP